MWMRMFRLKNTFQHDKMWAGLFFLKSILPLQGFFLKMSFGSCEAIVAFERRFVVLTANGSRGVKPGKEDARGRSMVDSQSWSPSHQTGAAAGEMIYMSSLKHALLVYTPRFCDHLNQMVIDYITNRGSRLGSFTWEKLVSWGTLTIWWHVWCLS